MATASTDRTLRLWDLERFEQVRECACALRAQVLRLVGRTLAKVLILGDGYHVSDRLPSFVLQVGLGLGVGVGC